MLTGPIVCIWPSDNCLGLHPRPIISQVLYAHNCLQPGLYPIHIDLLLGLYTIYRHHHIKGMMSPSYYISCIYIYIIIII